MSQIFHTRASIRKEYAKELGQLTGILRKHSLTRAAAGETFTLKSGKKSSYYLDVRKTAMRADGAVLLGRFLYDLVTDFEVDTIDYVAGVALGGCPLATACSFWSAFVGSDTTWQEQEDESIINALYVRPEVKEHGTGGQIMGAFTPGKGVILIEDVVTTGASAVKAFKVLEAAGLNVKGTLAIVDREEDDGAANIRVGTGKPFVSILTATDLLEG